MAKLTKTPTAAVQPAKGKKTTFAPPSSPPSGAELELGGLGGDDLDDLDLDELDSLSGSEGEGQSGSGSDEDEDSDDDAAPEEESTATGKQELLESERARLEFEASAKAARREAATKRASAKAASTSAQASSSKLPPPPAAAYLPDELFAEAEQARAARLAKEQAEAVRQRKLEQKRALADERGEGAAKRRRVLLSSDKVVGSTKVAVLPPTTSTTSSTTLAPAPVAPAVRKFKKRTLQTAAAPASAPLRTKMMVRGQGGKSWARKESHLSASQGRAGPALNFAGK